jgi:hypothetical protein
MSLKIECYNKNNCIALTVFGLQKTTMSSNFYYNLKGFFFIITDLAPFQDIQETDKFLAHQFQPNDIFVDK